MDYLFQALISVVVAGVFAWWVDRRGARRLTRMKGSIQAQSATEHGAIEARLVGLAARVATVERTQAPRVALPMAKRRLVSVTRDDDPAHTRATVEAPPPAEEVEPPSTKPARQVLPKSTPRPVPMGQQTERAVKRWEQRAGEIRDDATLASASDDGDGPTSAELDEALRQTCHAEADERDARHAALDPARPAVPPPAPAGDPEPDAAVGERFKHAPRPTDEHGEMTLQRAPHGLPSADVDDGDRATDEEGTKVYSRDPNDPTAQIPGVPVAPKPPASPTQRPPPHAPPRPIRSGRPTMLGGLAGAPFERPTSDAKRTAADFAARTGNPVVGGSFQGPPIDPATLRAERARIAPAARAAHEGSQDERDTLTPTDPSARPLDARVSRRWGRR